jgi:hypothetical protein
MTLSTDLSLLMKTPLSTASPKKAATQVNVPRTSIDPATLSSAEPIESTPDSSQTVTPPSPYLPNSQIQFAWDSTSLGLIKTCPRLYQYTMIEGWTTTSESVHLRFGQEYHAALQDFEIATAEGVEREAALHIAVEQLLARTIDWRVDLTAKPGKYKNRESLVGLVIDYLDHYNEDPATTFIKADGTPAVELSFRFELDFGPRGGAGTLTDDGIIGSQPYLLCGHLDRVVTFNDALMVMDHKTTTTTLNEAFFRQWSPSNQMTLYTLAGKVILNAPVRGVIISGAQLLLESPNRFVRGFTYRTPDQLDEWLGDLSITLRTAEAYASAGYWPQNDTACDKFGGCRFREVCSKSPQVRDKFLATDFHQLPEADRWNPLKSR